MKVSIITVSYNSVSTISDTIESVLSQSISSIEYIIVDGASSDGTLEIVNKYREHIAKVVSKPDSGVYHAMNQGIELATGDIIGFLNSDDIYASNDSLSKIVNVFSDPDVDACYGDLAYVARNDLDTITRYWKSCDYKPGLCKHGWMPAHPTFYVRADVLKKAGGFNLDYKLQADYELCLRLFEIEKINAVYLPEMLIKMRAGGMSNNSIKNIIRGNLEAYKACKRHYPETSPFFIPRKIFSRIGQFFNKPDNF